MKIKFRVEKNYIYAKEGLKEIKIIINKFNFLFYIFVYLYNFLYNFYI